MQKYLKLHAEPPVSMLDRIPAEFQWSHVLVIPACNESPALLGPPPPSDGRSLLILVINQSVSAPAEVTEANRVLANAVREELMLLWQPDKSGREGCPASPVQLYRDENSLRDVLLVDRFSDGRQLPLKGGVGHARKVGADLATALIHMGRVRSTWIHCSDGDVALPATYFDAEELMTGKVSECAALIYPFEHVSPADGSEHVMFATRLYELSLHYYVAGLKYAHSPYAFHTIGSTMAVNASHYAMVRGFPKREAGEDFYLLNKLAKVGDIQELTCTPDFLPIRIEARKSDRVPFGTGAAVNTITNLPDPRQDYLYYHPQVFELLRFWIQSWPNLWEMGTPELLNLGAIRSEEPLQPEQHASLISVLESLRTEAALKHAFRQSKDLTQFIRQMHTWFDAFRTLKLIHGLREHDYRSMSLQDLTSHPTFRVLLANDQVQGDYCRSLLRWIRI